jgi:hypothetical protein
MKSLRIGLSVAGCVLLMLGYFASQYAYLVQGDPSGYAAKLDQPPIRELAVLFFVAALILAFIPDQNGDKS